MDVRGKRIFVGLSGGVDSAVSAALLQKAGAEVVGVFIKGWYPPGMPCSWAEDRRDAMRVAARLRIPFVTLDAAAEYKKSVIDYLLAEYRAGRTPNPDVMCNRDIKFGVFYRYAVKHGAHHIATGHYRAGEKDQTYFLWAVPREILAATIFPVGKLDKRRVRVLARELKLPVAEKKDSQGVCFLGAVSVKDFLERELGTNPAILHTIGERIDGQYVLAKDVDRGTIKLGRKDAAPAASSIRFLDANWHDARGKAAAAQIRYRGPLIKGRIVEDAFVPALPLAEPAVPGQSIVFYSEGGALVGGGIIG